MKGMMLRRNPWKYIPVLITSSFLSRLLFKQLISLLSQSRVAIMGKSIL